MGLKVKGTCDALMHGGDHVMCCAKTIGLRTRWIHNGLVWEWARILTTAGNHIRVEQIDPSMGSNARLDLVQFQNEAAGSGAYDVSAVTWAVSDERALGKAAVEAGSLANVRYHDKLARQYKNRTGRLIPLIVECGGRWHSHTERLILQLSRQAAQRTAGWGAGSEALIRSRWAARLSATLLRGVAQVYLDALPGLTHTGRPWSETGVDGRESLEHQIPEGPSAYELWVR
jgi:hypothetical protein